MRNDRCGNSIKIFCAVAMLLATVAQPAVVAAETATPSQKQVMLSMAYAANLSGELTGESAEVSKQMAPLLDCFLDLGDAVKDQWTVVWGPEVVTKRYKPSSLCKVPEPKDKVPVPANTMFVARKAGENTYVIAIAGTNKSSAYAWCEEDFNIIPFHWPYGETAWNADATIGTLKGLKELQGMSDPDKGKIQDFLNTVTGESTTIYVTGHSLGGALAPAFAQWLADTRTKWDPNKNATLQIFAFAGATPGNRVFADHVNATFPGEVSSPAQPIPSPWLLSTTPSTLCLTPGTLWRRSRVSTRLPRSSPVRSR